MSSRIRLAVIAAVVAAGAVTGLALNGSRQGSGGASPKALPTSTKAAQLPPQCLSIPAAKAVPAWYPKDLPMPAGSVVTDVPATTGQLRRIVYATSGTLRDFVKHALTAWPAQGWRLGRGESEPGEAEDQFIKGQQRYGLFKAQSAYCDLNRTWVLIVIRDPSLPASPTPSPSRS